MGAEIDVRLLEGRWQVQRRSPSRQGLAGRQTRA